MSKWIKTVALVLLTPLALCSGAMADGATTRPATGPSALPATEPASPPAKWFEFGKTLSHPHTEPNTDSPRLVPWVDYTGDLTQRAALTGDWWGFRQKLMDRGVRLNANLTQTMQGNLDGGVSRRSWYQGGMRIDLDVDTDAAGLWPGGWLHIRGETPFGKNDNSDSGAIMLVNTDAQYPVPGRSMTCLSEAYYTQFVAPWLGFMAGKMSPRETNVFAHDETTQFMNTAFNFNPVMGATVPVDFLGAGAVFIPFDWFNLTTVVLDAEGKANVSGFDTASDRGTSVFQKAEFAIKPFGQQGHQRVSWTWSDKRAIELEQDPLLILRGLVLERMGLGTGPTLKKRNGDWSVMYDFDQYLYTKEGTKDQGFGLFGRYGHSDGVVNPIQDFYSLGVGGKGMIPGRDSDTFGVGYYYLAVSDHMGPVLSRLIDDEKGVEIFYNIEITPWMHVTPDIQIIDGGRRAMADEAVVAGIRMRIDF